MLDAGDGSLSVTSPNTTAVSHKHRHAPHTRHIDPKTDVMGPRLAHFWNRSLIDQSEFRKLFYRTDLEKSRSGPGGSRLAPFNRFYTQSQTKQKSRTKRVLRSHYRKISVAAEIA